VGCEQGLTTIEKEFLAYTVLPNGQTMTEWLEPQVERMVTSGKMPQPLLMGSVGKD